MNKLLIFFLFSPSLFASELCTRTQSDIKKSLSEVSNRISFKNAGGLINGGVCWWHSRLQRSSAYLIKWKPSDPAPSKPELNYILRTLRLMNKTVIIPGYSDLETFTNDYKEEIQEMLNDWQKRDGFLNFEWLRGISGSSSLSPEAMKLRMEDVYRHYKKSPSPLWIMAQIKGITSHSLLILDMEQTSHGFEISVIDSNHPKETINIEYNFGDRNLRATGEKYSFVPYVGFQKDFLSISKALKEECGNLLDILPVQELEPGQIEL